MLSMRLVVLAAFQALLLGRTLAQTSSVKCAPTYQWAFNSLNQSPCIVAAYLQKACSNSSISINPLPPGAEYADPTSTDASSCACNTVVYSLVSACADCQSRSFSTWSTWIQNCSSVTNGSFPLKVPKGTVIPGWASLDVTAANSYNATKAEAVVVMEVQPSKASKPVNVFGAVFAVIASMIMFVIIGNIVIRYRMRRRTASEAGDTELAKTSVITSEYGGMAVDAVKLPEIQEKLEISTTPRPLPTIPKFRSSTTSLQAGSSRHVADTSSSWALAKRSSQRDGTS